FDPLAYSKTFAMAFSTLFTLFLLPIVTVWIFERENAPKPMRYWRPIAFGGLVLLLAGAWRFRVTVREFLPEIVELGIILIPVIILWIVRKRAGTAHNYQDSNPIRAYRSLLTAAIQHRYAFCATGLLLLIPGVIVLNGFQRDFLPETDEGSILYMPTTLPGLPTREAGWVLQQMDKKLKQFPEVDRVFGKLGRADTSTDPAPVSMVETTILLKPRSQWRP